MAEIWIGGNCEQLRFVDNTKFAPLTRTGSGRYCSARAADGRMARATGDLFERIKVKMVMRIYHVSCKRAKAIIAGRAAEKEALDVKKTPRNWVRISRHVCDDDDELL